MTTHDARPDSILHSACSRTYEIHMPLLDAGGPNANAPVLRSVLALSRNARRSTKTSNAHLLLIFHADVFIGRAGGVGKGIHVGGGGEKQAHNGTPPTNHTRHKHHISKRQEHEAYTTTSDRPNASTPIRRHDHDPAADGGLRDEKRASAAA
mmetsp:Transcript_11233/g.34603  ORF Transcript_11233/g.34603 Transcript_11233/m.34603 type:complete len:152 (+) Transcript_11233:119-574(+)